MSSSSDTLLNKSKVNFSVLSILKRINIYWLIITVVVFISLVKLGFWQSGRALEKEQRLARIESLNQKAPISLEKLVALSTTENINDFPVMASGYFDAEKIFLLDNQVSNGRLGYRVLQVLTTAEYSVLVNLGWVQGAISRQKLPDITPLVGKHHFESRVRIIEPGIVLMEQDFSLVNWPLRIQQIELDKFSTLLNKPLLPFVLYVSETESIGFVKQWQPIVMPPEKHQGYAFQWFSLAFAWFCLMCWAAFGQRNK